MAAIIAALAFSTPAVAHKVSWHKTGASIYGGFCEPWETKGYRGAYLPATPWSFAELGMGSAMGSLPNKARVRILSPATHKKTWVTKEDIGGGGDPVQGYRRSIDLYAPVAQWIAGADCNWTGTIDWRK